MSKEGRHHLLIPALIAAIAAYFGFRRKSESLATVARALVGQAIDDQVQHNQSRRPRVRSKNHRKFRDNRHT